MNDIRHILNKLDGVTNEAPDNTDIDIKKLLNGNSLC